MNDEQAPEQPQPDPASIEGVGGDGGHGGGEPTREGDNGEREPVPNAGNQHEPNPVVTDEADVPGYADPDRPDLARQADEPAPGAVDPSRR